MNSSRLPSPSRPEFIESPRLKRNYSGSNVERTLRFHALSEITIQIGACERDDQRQARAGAVEPIDRIKAAPGVKRNKKIDFFAAVIVKDDCLMSNLSKNPRPAKRCDLIAGP